MSTPSSMPIGLAVKLPRRHGCAPAIGELATPSDSSASMRLRAWPVPSSTQSSVSLSVTRKPRL
jgi:hypothetical protein